jgi:hypothetical protein
VKIRRACHYPSSSVFEVLIVYCKEGKVNETFLPSSSAEVWNCREFYLCMLWCLDESTLSRHCWCVRHVGYIYIYIYIYTFFVQTSQIPTLFGCLQGTVEFISICIISHSYLILLYHIQWGHAFCTSSWLLAHVWNFVAYCLLQSKHKVAIYSVKIFNLFFSKIKIFYTDL